MNLREILPTVLLGLLGIVAAAGIALAANEVSGGQIALSADPVFGVADERLVEPGERRKGESDDPGRENAPTVSVNEGGGESAATDGDADGGGSGRSGDGGRSDDGGPAGGSDQGPDKVEVEEPEDSDSESDHSGSGGSGSGSGGSGSGGNSGPGGGDD